MMLLVGTSTTFVGCTPDQIENEQQADKDEEVEDKDLNLQQKSGHLVKSHAATF